MSAAWPRRTCTTGKHAIFRHLKPSTVHALLFNGNDLSVLCHSCDWKRRLSRREVSNNYINWYFVSNSWWTQRKATTNIWPVLASSTIWNNIRCLISIPFLQFVTFLLHESEIPEINVHHEGAAASPQLVSGSRGLQMQWPHFLAPQELLCSITPVKCAAWCVWEAKHRTYGFWR